MAAVDNLLTPCLEKGARALSRRDFVRGGCALASALSFSGSAKAETKDGASALRDASLMTRVLLVYNTNSPDSVAIKDHYVSNRPGMGSVDTLGVAADTTEKTTPANLVSQIRTPIYNFLASSPNKKYYVIMCRGLSSRVWSEGNGYASVDYLLSRADSNLSNSVGREYSGRINFQLEYAPATYPGTTFLVTRLDMGSLAATRAYINKIKRVCNAMSTPSLTVSAQSAGLGGTNYLLDELREAAYQAYALIASDENYLKSVTAVDSGRLTYTRTAPNAKRDRDVLGYETWGVHGGMPGTYPYDGTISFGGNSNWWLVKTIESYNGIIASGQGNFEGFFNPRCAGGFNYSRTPVGMACHTDEPRLNGIEGPQYLVNWEKGLLFSECAWSSRNTPFFMAVGDPLVAR